MEIIVSRRIRELMQEEGLNQVKLAEKIGIKQNTISAWLLGKKGTMHSQPLEVGGLFRRGYRLYSGQEELLVHFAKSARRCADFALYRRFIYSKNRLTARLPANALFRGRSRFRISRPRSPWRAFVFPWRRCTDTLRT